MKKKKKADGGINLPYQPNPYAWQMVSQPYQYPQATPLQETASGQYPQGMIPMANNIQGSSAVQPISNPFSTPSPNQPTVENKTSSPINVQKGMNNVSQYAGAAGNIVGGIIGSLSAFSSLIPNQQTERVERIPKALPQPMGNQYNTQMIFQDGGNIGTKLNKSQEKKYQAWRAKLPQALQYEGDYDLRGLYLSNPNAAPSANLHFPDTYKLPNHRTFSNESVYFSPQTRDQAGYWMQTDSSNNYIPYNPAIKDTVIERFDGGGSLDGYVDNGKGQKVKSWKVGNIEVSQEMPSWYTPSPIPTTPVPIQQRNIQPLSSVALPNIPTERRVEYEDLVIPKFYKRADGTYKDRVYKKPVFRGDWNNNQINNFFSQLPQNSIYPTDASIYDQYGEYDNYDMSYFANGGNVSGNKLEVENGSAVPISPSFGMLNGPSHEAGGTHFSYNNSPAEAYGGESFTILPNGDMSLFGKQRVELNGKKTTFNKYAKHLSEEENKANKQIKKADSLLESPAKSKWGTLAVNTARILAEGAGMKKSLIDAERQTLAALQDTRLALANSLNTDAQSIPSFEKGGIMKFDPGGRKKGKWEFNGTNYEGVDPKIKKFVEMLEERGYSGYSGPKSGVSQRNTKSGRLSRHAKGQALDMFFNDKDPYKAILQDIDLSNYLMENGLTVLNEYDPNVAKGTGATAGHLHVGYDRGTALAEQFRKDVAKQWPGWNNEKTPVTPYPGNNRAIPTLPYGDMQDDPIVPPNFGPSGDPTLPYTPITPSTLIETGNKPEIPNWDTSTYTPKAPTNTAQARRKPSLTEQNRFNPASIFPELMGMFQQPDNVPYQEYNPTLLTPYQVSFQDQVDNNNATFRQIAQQTNNPQALSVLAGQTYANNAQVMANQFRTNQEINNNVTNQNVQILNQAELQNLQLQDIQQQRMAQAKSNTRRDRNIAANSIAAKIAQNKQENNTIRLYESMSNYRFDPQQGQYGYYGPNHQFSLNGMSPNPGNDKITTFTDESGNTSTKKVDDPTTEQWRQFQMYMKMQQQQFPNSRRR